METTSAPPEAGPGRRRVPVRTRLDFWFDGALLVTYTLAYSLGFTGLALHEWLGLGIGLALLTLILVPVHAALRWRWIVSVGRRLLSSRLPGDHRLGDHRLGRSRRSR